MPATVRRHRPGPRCGNRITPSCPCSQEPTSGRWKQMAYMFGQLVGFAILVLIAVAVVRDVSAKRRSKAENEAAETSMF